MPAPLEAYRYVNSRRQVLIDSARQQPLVRMQDKNYNQLAQIGQEISCYFEEIAADTGEAGVVIRGGDYLADFVRNAVRIEEDLHLSIDPIGTKPNWRTRWGGKITTINVKRDSSGIHTVELIASANREHLKNILIGSTPFFPPEIQPLKMWLMPANIRTGCMITLAINLARLFFPIATVPANILNPFGWINPLGLDAILNSNTYCRWKTSSTSCVLSEEPHQGFDKDAGFEYIGTAGGLRGNLVPLIAWAPVGDHDHCLLRPDGDGQDPHHPEHRQSRRSIGGIELETLDAPESPAFSPDGKVDCVCRRCPVGVLGYLRGGSGDETDRRTSPRTTSPTTRRRLRPDGPSSTTRASQRNDKLFQSRSARPADKKQLTFGSHDDTAAQVLQRPRRSCSPRRRPIRTRLRCRSVARNGNIPNVWTLDLGTASSPAGRTR